MNRVLEPEVMADEVEARAYEEADFYQVNLRCARRAFRLVEGKRGRAIDLGTGPAEIPILFCQLAPGWKVTAVDASPAMLTLARKWVRQAGLAQRISLRRGDAKNLGRRSRRYDLVFSNSLLHHLPDPLPFWRQVQRLVKPGGAVMVQDLRRPRSRAEARRLVRRHAGDASRLLKELFYQSLLAAFTPTEIRRQLDAAGLEGLRVRAINDRHLVVRGYCRFFRRNI
jgi:ubiquinone/menaquinone biosynthesis C-methylase UbiE